MFVKKGVYKPLVAPKLFDAAQRRLESFSLKGSRRPREDGFPLTGILICDHCGKPMYGCHPTGRNTKVYRCSSNAKTGSGSCGTYFIYEADILPFLLTELGKEIEAVKKINTPCPDHLLRPEKERKRRTAELERQIAVIRKRIESAMVRSMEVKDAEARAAVDRRLTTFYAQRDALLKELESLQAGDTEQQQKRADAERLNEWWQANKAALFFIPVEPGLDREIDPIAEGRERLHTPGMPIPQMRTGKFVDPRAINEALHQLGCEVRLRWKTTQVKLKNGKTQNRYKFGWLRLRLGQRNERFSKLPLAALHNSRSPGMAQATLTLPNNMFGPITSGRPTAAQAQAAGRSSQHQNQGISPSRRRPPMCSQAGRTARNARCRANMPLPGPRPLGALTSRIRRTSIGRD
jgi:hypothetical protein